MAIFIAIMKVALGTVYFIESMPVFLTTRVLGEGQGSERFSPCACEAQDIRKAFRKITLGVAG